MTDPDPFSLFSHWADADPGAACVGEAGRSLTYGDMAALAGRLAAAISAAGEHPKVLIHLPQGGPAYAAMMATLMAGGYYSCSNSAWPPDRQARVVDRFAPDVIVVGPGMGLGGLAVPDGCRLVDCGDLPAKGLSVPKPPHDLAYVMFTSGSTGMPKGVMVPRTGLAHYVAWARDAMSLAPDDRWSQHPNIAFDLSVLDIYGALCSGASLYPLTTPKDRMLPAAFVKANRLTIWDSVPSVLDMMRGAGQVTTDHLASLRMLTFCGEPLHREQVDAVFAARPDVTVHNTYGPTEATVSCTLLRLDPDNLDAASGQCMAFGEPIPGMDLMLADGPNADEGEILLSGPQLARGYWRDEEATAKAFVDLPAGGGGTRRWYRTGDWGRRERGHTFFVQRIDHQIKIRGYRVELGEIDKAAREMGARAACTVYVAGALHCFLEADGQVDIDRMRAGMARLLPEYAVPSAFHQLAALPRNANEKIDAKLLREQVEAAS